LKEKLLYAFFSATFPDKLNYSRMRVISSVIFNLCFGRTFIYSENKYLANRLVLIKKGVPKFLNFLPHALEIHFLPSANTALITGLSFYQFSHFFQLLLYLSDLNIAEHLIVHRDSRNQTT